MCPYRPFLAPCLFLTEVQARGILDKVEQRPPSRRLIQSQAGCSWFKPLTGAGAIKLLPLSSCKENIRNTRTCTHLWFPKIGIISHNLASSVSRSFKFISWLSPLITAFYNLYKIAFIFYYFTSYPISRWTMYMPLLWPLESYLIFLNGSFMVKYDNKEYL